VDQSNQSKIETLAQNNLNQSICNILSSDEYKVSIANTQFHLNPFTESPDRFEIIPSILISSSFNYQFIDNRLIFYTSSFDGELRYKTKNEPVLYGNTLRRPILFDGTVEEISYTWKFDNDTGEPIVNCENKIRISSMNIDGHRVPLPETK